MKSILLEPHLHGTATIWQWYESRSSRSFLDGTGIEKGIICLAHAQGIRPLAYQWKKHSDRP